MVIRRDAYRRAPFSVEKVRLRIDLDVPHTTVFASTTYHRVDQSAENLVLDGVGLELTSIALDGRPLRTDEYVITERGLEIPHVPASFTLDITTRASVLGTLEGVIYLDGIFVSNCEPEGFRRITYFQDRPDVLAVMECELTADVARAPILLSNGSCVERRRLANGRHSARWVDPHPKAPYLFAVAAGHFSAVEDQFVTADRRVVKLAVYADPEEIRFCNYGLASLKKAMEWDESYYGCVYDLDELNVVVVRSYPGGAMEHKGLNIYASEFFLAADEVSTDLEKEIVHETVAHEYFHNWSGNRVGIESWFELSLKEGLTVFRQQQFASTSLSSSESRIETVSRLERLQYHEDAGGFSHPVRPVSYQAVNNMYTSTVYLRGAEICRMLMLLVGEEAFKSIVRAFFRRFDGKAASIDDWLQVASETTGRDLTNFAKWYDFAGLLNVTVKEDHCAGQGLVTLHFSQADMAGNETSLTMPVDVALIDRDGNQLVSESVVLREPRQSYTFPVKGENPIVSVFRGLSAPVQVSIDRTVSDWLRLAVNDSDPVGRWRAMRELAEGAVVRGSSDSEDAWLEGVSEILSTARRDPGGASRILEIPPEALLARGEKAVDLDTWHSSRRRLASRVGVSFRKELRQIYADLASEASPRAGAGARRMRALCLFYLMHEAEPGDREVCRMQAGESPVMAERFAALRLAVSYDPEARAALLERAYEDWKECPLALDHWFSVQGLSDADDCARSVDALTRHRDYSLANATRIKALFDSFGQNMAAFHHGSGIGYLCVSEAAVALDKENPRLAARLAKNFNGLYRLDPWRSHLMSMHLRRIIAMPETSVELKDVTSRILQT